MSFYLQKITLLKSLSFCRGRALLLCLFVLPIQHSFASSSQSLCHSYFAETDIWQSLDPVELATIHIAVRSYVGMRGTVDAESLHAKELLQSELTNFQRRKKYNLEQQRHFSNLFRRQVREYRQLTAHEEVQELQRLGIEYQRRIDHFEHTKIQQKISDIFKKYNVSDIHTALDRICSKEKILPPDVDDVRFLLQNGANPNFKTAFFSAFQIAVLRGHTDIVPFLLHYGADVNTLFMLNQTPLLLASEYGNLRIVKLLIEAGANLNHIDHKGNTAFSLASQGGHLDVLKYLMSQEKNLNIQSDQYRLRLEKF